jgi:hypothetical protein
LDGIRQYKYLHTITQLVHASADFELAITIPKVLYTAKLIAINETTPFDLQPNAYHRCIQLHAHCHEAEGAINPM